jgi:hypothetical protein
MVQTSSWNQTFYNNTGFLIVQSILHILEKNVLYTNSLDNSHNRSTFEIKEFLLLVYLILQVIPCVALQAAVIVTD